MITILHGDNFVASRNALNQIKNATKLDAKRISQEDLSQALASKALFEDQKPIVIENLLSLPRSKDKQVLIDIVLNNNDKDVYLWDKKTITPAVKKQFSNAKIQEFKAPKLVFKLLDLLKPKNPSNFLVLLHQTLGTEPTELVFYFLHRRVSQLIVALDSPRELKGAPWQVGKLKSQAKQFNLKQLLNLHQNLVKIDYQIKSGKAVLPLASQLDLLFLNL